jgi:hypothetical protein
MSSEGPEITRQPLRHRRGSEPIPSRAREQAIALLLSGIQSA